MSRPALARFTELVRRSDAVGENDAELLARFARSRDPGALAEVVRRHGSLVRNASGRWLRGGDAVDDVFQATFLLLAQQAGAKRWGSTVGPWLYAVAIRLARKALAKSAATRRCTISTDELPAPTVDPSAPLAWAEVRKALDEELGRLPGRLRDPIVLCFLEGHTRDEAARLLGWSLATLKRRLERGRNLLRDRLTRRGLALAAAGVGPLLAGPPVSASAAHALAAAVAQFVASGQPPAPVAALVASSRTGGVNVRLAAVLAVSFGACAFAAFAPTAEHHSPATPSGVNAPTTVPGRPVPTGAVGDPLPPGAVTRLGSTRLTPGAIAGHIRFSPDGSKLAFSAWDGLLTGPISIWDTATGRLLRRTSAHIGAVTAMEWLADGRGIAVVSFGSEAPPCVWEFTDESAPPPGYEKGDARDLAHAISPDGTTIAVAHSAGPGRGYTLQVHPLKTRVRTDQLAPGKVLVTEPEDCRKLMYSPDGKTLISVHPPKYPMDPERRHLVTVWDVASGRRKARFTLPQTVENFNSLALDLSNHSLVVGRAQHDPTVVDLESGKEHFFHFPDGPARSAAGRYTSTFAVAYGPGAKLFAAGTYFCDPSRFDNVIDLWDVAGGKHVRRHARLGGAAAAIAFSRDGRLLATAGQDRRIRLWDVDTGAERCPQPGHQGPVTAAIFAPDGKTVVTSAVDCTVRWWDASDGREFRSAELPAGASGLTVSPDGRTLLACLGNRGVLTWDMETGRENTPADLGGDKKFAGLAFSPDGRHLVGASDAEVSVWHWPTLKLARKIKLPKPHKGPGETRCGSVAVSPDSRWLVTVSARTAPDYSIRDGVIDLWEVETGTWVRRLAESPHVFDGVQFLPTGQLVVSGTKGVTVPGSPPPNQDDEIHLIDPAAGRRVRSLTLPPVRNGNATYLGSTHSICLSRDGRTVYDGQVLGKILVFELATWTPRHEFSGHVSAVRSLSLSPDGKRLLSGSDDGTAMIWDATLAAIPTDPDGLAVPTHPDGLWETLGAPDTRLAASAMGRLVRLRDRGVEVLRQKLKPVPPAPTDSDLDAIFRGLDSPVFATRENASKRLAAYRDSAVSAVRTRLDQEVPPEARQRAEAFLARFGGAAPSTDRLRELRGVEVLEEVATPAARALLAELAAGAPGTPLTRDAAAARARLGGR